MATDRGWLFGPRQDLAVFLGVGLLSIAFALCAGPLGLRGETPLLLWVVVVLGIDVAHVWATLFRVYFDAEELRRRPVLYAAAPVLGDAGGVALHAVSSGLFWRVLAYTAVLHFIRQQVGWMALYGRRAGSSVAQRRFDAVAIYAATLGPLIWWHAHLPRAFWWFVEGDFVTGLPAWMGTVALGLEAVVLVAWAGRWLLAWRRGAGHPGKAGLLVATGLVWFVGIVVARDDVGFTVTNVVLHGVPYFALVYRYAQQRGREPGGYALAAFALRAGVAGFFGVLLVCAFLEEAAWDKLVWHERAGLFGAGGWSLSDGALALVVPLLALPQVTHYLLDGFVWRGQSNPFLARRLGWSGGAD